VALDCTAVNTVYSEALSPVL